MSSTVQISLNNVRENQLADIQSMRSDIPKGQSEAINFLLFEYIEKILGVKKE